MCNTNKNNSFVTITEPWAMFKPFVANTETVATVVYFTWEFALSF